MAFNYRATNKPWDRVQNIWLSLREALNPRRMAFNCSWNKLTWSYLTGLSSNIFGDIPSVLMRPIGLLGLRPALFLIDLLTGFGNLLSPPGGTSFDKFFSICLLMILVLFLVLFFNCSPWQAPNRVWHGILGNNNWNVDQILGRQVRKAHLLLRYRCGFALLGRASHSSFHPHRGAKGEFEGKSPQGSAPLKASQRNRFMA